MYLVIVLSFPKWLGYLEEMTFRMDWATLAIVILFKSSIPSIE